MWTGALFALNAILNLGLALALARALPAASYGAFTVYFASAILIGNLAFDWARFSAMRFYTPTSRLAEPALRATLDVSLYASIAIAAVVSVAFALAGALPEVTPASVAALVAVVVANAGYEYWTALCRARFDARRYGVMVMARNVLTFGLSVPVALLTGSFTLTLAAFACAVVPSILYGMVRLHDIEARPALATRALAARFARYAAPIVLAEGCYLAMAVANRAFLAHGASLIAAGAYALTFDLAFRTLAVTASVGDAVLFPRLVANLHAQGAARTRAEVSRNVAVMLLVLVPAAIGFALVTGPLARLLLAEQFRPAFASYGPAAVAAAFAYTVQTFVLRPAFQVELRTADMTLAAIAAVMVDAILLALVPGDGIFVASLAHLAGLVVGLAIVLRRAIGSRLVDWPLVDIGKIALGAALLALGVAAIRFDDHPLATLMARAACGAVIYGAVTWMTDAVGLRSLLRGARGTLAGKRAETTDTARRATPI